MLADNIVPVNVELLACGTSRGHVTDGLGKLRQLESHRAGQEQVGKYGGLLDAVCASERQLGHRTCVHLLTSVEVTTLKACDGKVVDARREQNKLWLSWVNNLIVPADCVTFSTSHVLSPFSS